VADATRLDVLIKSRDDLKKTIENLITDLSGPLAPSEKSYKEELLLISRLPLSRPKLKFSAGAINSTNPIFENSALHHDS
jgi:hypothetical protein